MPFLQSDKNLLPSPLTFTRTPSSFYILERLKWLPVSASLPSSSFSSSLPTPTPMMTSPETRDTERQMAISLFSRPSGLPPPPPPSPRLTDPDLRPSYASIVTANNSNRNSATNSNSGSNSNKDPYRHVADPASFQAKWYFGEAANPRNFSRWRKIWCTVILSLLTFAGSMGTAAIAPAEMTLAAEFHISHEATVLTIALFVLGLASGPLIFAPICEVYGRRLSMIPAVFAMGLFSVGCGLSQTANTLFVMRFLSGACASAPISNVPAALGDLYEPRHRGIAMAFMSACVVGGPTVAPVMGAALTASQHLGWRWTEYIQAIFCAAIAAVALFTVPETYEPVLLVRKAADMRRNTGDARWWHPHESERLSLNRTIKKHFTRPMLMLFTEPIITAIAFYAAFVFGLLFLMLEVIPIVFLEQRKWSPVLSTLPFLGIFVGVCLSLGVNIANQPAYARATARNDGRAVPEARLPPIIIGGLFYSVGLFLFGWTAAPPYHWLFSICGLALIGAGFNTIFQQCLNYIVDAYLLYAASAISATVFSRSIMACGMPLVARPMFLNLGVARAATILGGISCILMPVPVLLMRYGQTLLNMSPYARDQHRYV